MQIIKPDIEGLLIFEPKIFGDERGFFLETYNKKRYQEAGLEVEFVQDNLSFSRKGVLRGLHFQNPNGQGKLISVIQGEVFDVSVDLRLGSPTFGKSFSLYLSGEKKNQIYIPVGFAHGFCVTSETALFSYKCTEIYNPATEKCLLWNDSDLKIAWPITNPTLSEKDKSGIKLKDFKTEDLTKYESK